MRTPAGVIGPRSQGLWKPVIGRGQRNGVRRSLLPLGQVDFIVAAEHATFFDPHVTYGMPAVFEPALMGERMPFGEVMRMTLMGNQERISAKKAEQIGLVTQVVAFGRVGRGDPSARRDDRVVLPRCGAGFAPSSLGLSGDAHPRSDGRVGQSLPEPRDLGRIASQQPEHVHPSKRRPLSATIPG